jgi:hypothetical protein
MGDKPDLITAFEGSMIEVELLAQKPGKVNSCILVNYMFRTRPEMNYTQEYQRGPIHLGRVEIDFRAYAWTDKEVKNYIKMKQAEDIQLLGLVDGSVKAALDSLGDELMRYLEESGESMIPKEQREPEGKNPYKTLFSGFGQLFSPFQGPKKPKMPKVKKESSADMMKLSIEKKQVSKSTEDVMWNIYHHFKKQHNMLSW